MQVYKQSLYVLHPDLFVFWYPLRSDLVISGTEFDAELKKNKPISIAWNQNPIHRLCTSQPSCYNERSRTQELKRKIQWSTDVFII